MKSQTMKLKKLAEMYLGKEPKVCPKYKSSYWDVGGRSWVGKW